MDTKKMRSCSHLLPAPGGEVVCECLDVAEATNNALRKELLAAQHRIKVLREAAETAKDQLRCTDSWAFEPLVEALAAPDNTTTKPEQSK